MFNKLFFICYNWGHCFPLLYDSWTKVGTSLSAGTIVTQHN